MATKTRDKKVSKGVEKGDLCTLNGRVDGYAGRLGKTPQEFLKKLKQNYYMICKEYYVMHLCGNKYRGSEVRHEEVSPHSL